MEMHDHQDCYQNKVGSISRPLYNVSSFLFIRISLVYRTNTRPVSSPETQKLLTEILQRHLGIHAEQQNQANIDWKTVSLVTDIDPVVKFNVGFNF